MITLKFCKWHNMKNMQTFGFNTYKEFFDFYVKNANEGCVFNVKDDGNTK